MPIAAKLIPLAMALPIFFLHPLPTPVVWLTLSVSVIAALLFPWRVPIDRLGLSHGAIYFVAFTLLSLYQLYGTPWIVTYTAWMTATLAVWVVFKLLFKRHLKIFLTSGFELLIIILSWFVPVFLGQAAYVTSAQQQLVSIVCMEAIPVLLAMKIIICKQPRRNSVLAGSMIAVLMIISVKNMIQ